jgi:murein DD-endopeptidase MepM/ murein hydrolase activator NlpD
MNRKTVKIVFGCMIAVMLISSGVYRYSKGSNDPADEMGVDNNLSSDSSNVSRKIAGTLLHQSVYREVKDRFNKGDNMSLALSRHDVTAQEIHYIAKATSEKIKLNRIQAGTPFTLFFEPSENSLQAIHMRTDQRHLLKLTKQPDESWQSALEEISTEISLHRSAGTVTESLWQAAIKAEIPPATILDMADLFGWQIDFATELRKGDSFQLVYEKERFPDGEIVPSAIKAASFTNQSQSYHVYSYMFPDGSSEYFDEQGASVRRTFLKSPLRYRYISSGFSYKRFHPILKKHRPHLGIDYAAPSGTPVSALGDGTVIFRGWKGGYGNFVQIKHGDAYVTSYGHLSRFGSGIKKGTRVKQGQIIGYVGSTGLSTGPHLDFRVQYRGKYMNPLRLKSPPAEPIPEIHRDAFLLEKDNWARSLEKGLS